MLQSSFVFQTCEQLSLTFSLMRDLSVDSVHPIGGGPHKAAENTELPFEDIQVWFKLRLQTTEIHTHSILPAQTLLVSPPEGNWKYGCYDSVVVNVDGTKIWPASGLQGLLSIILFRISTIFIPCLIRTLDCTTLPHYAALGQAA